uniref:Uncharacterized protein n=1 Tax=Parascaris equorum TaxID=6256 RepID=A0A914RW66_PAREQ
MGSNEGNFQGQSLSVPDYHQKPCKELGVGTWTGIRVSRINPSETKGGDLSSFHNISYRYCNFLMSFYFESSVIGRRHATEVYE